MATSYYVRLATHSVEDAESITVANEGVQTVSELKDAIIRSGVFEREGLIKKGNILAIHFKDQLVHSHLVLGSEEAHQLGLLPEATLEVPLVITLAPLVKDTKTVEDEGVYIFIRSHLGTYISARPNGQLHASAPNPAEDETWIMRRMPSHHGECVSLQSFHGKYLCSDPAGVTTADRDHSQAWESWGLVRHGPTKQAGWDNVSFRSYFNRFLCVESPTSVVANREKLDQWETYSINVIGTVKESPNILDPVSINQPIVKQPLPSELERLLYEVGLERLAPLFIEEEIFECRLVEERLGLSGLQAIGVPTGPAIKLLDAISGQKQKEEKGGSGEKERGVEGVGRVLTTAGEMGVKEIVDELIHGTGWVVLPKVIPKAMIKQARRLLMGEVMKCSPEGKWKSRAEQGRQRRVRGIFRLGEVFDYIATLPIVVETCKAILGEDFILGSFDGNILLPSCAKSGEHQDYPYWSKTESARLGIFQMGERVATHLFEVQTIIALDDFTPDNGATWMLKGSQRSPELFWTGKPKDFWGEADQLCCPAGSVIIGNGRTWHSAGGNNTGVSRVALLGQYLRKEVMRMGPEFDYENSMEREHIRTASEGLQRICRPTEVGGN